MQITSCFLAALVAVLSAACSGGAVVVTPMGASLVAPVSVSVSQSPPARAAFVGYGCQVGSFVTTTFDVVVVASSPVNLDRLTVRLIDGSHVGGPMVTIPQAELTNQFGTVLILGGTLVLGLVGGWFGGQLFPPIVRYHKRATTVSAAAIPCPVTSISSRLNAGCAPSTAGEKRE